MEISRRRPIRFLDEAVQKHHFVFVDAKQDSGDSIPQAASRLEQPIAEGPADRQANRPAVLDGLDVDADRDAILLVQSSEPVPNRFVPACGPIEASGYSFRARQWSGVYQK